MLGIKMQGHSRNTTDLKLTNKFNSYLERLPLTFHHLEPNRGFPSDSVVKNPPTNTGDTRDTGLIPGWKDPLEEKIATHSSMLAWKTEWAEGPGKLQSMGLQRVRHNRACTRTQAKVIHEV